jgi:hypothetical protein
MSIERYLRLIAGSFVMASVALGCVSQLVSIHCLVGLNLFQSALRTGVR